VASPPFSGVPVVLTLLAPLPVSGARETLLSQTIVYTQLRTECARSVFAGAEVSCSSRIFRCYKLKFWLDFTAGMFIVLL